MLASLLNPPDSPETWQRWSFDNRTSHDAIRAGIATRGGREPDDLVIDPIDFANFQDWLLRHAMTHQQMDAALGLQSADLSVLNPDDQQAVQAWMSIHSLEHQNAELLSRAID